MKFLAIATYTSVDESGKVKTFKDHYLVEAQSVSDAEAATIKHVGIGIGAQIEVVKKYKVSEVFFSKHNPELPFWQVTVGIETFNEKTKKIKLTKTEVLAQANSLADATVDMFAEFGRLGEIHKVSKTKIMDYINPAA